MMPLEYLRIAGVRFDLQSPEFLELSASERGYATFLGEGTSPAEVMVRVSLDLTGVPDMAHRERLFDSEQAWSMFRDGNARFILFQPPPLNAPLWCARIDLSTLSVTLYCGPGLIRQAAGRRTLINPLRYPLDLLLTMYVLAGRRGAIVHAAGLALKGRGFLFAGRSGAGKSTLSRQFASVPDAPVLSDDRVVIRAVDAGFDMSGTPWGGEAEKGESQSCPLAAMFFLRQAAENRIRKLETRDAAERLLAAVSIPWYDRDVIPGVLSFCGGLAERIPSYELQFRPTVDVADLLMEHAEGC